MLILTRRCGQSIKIGDDIEVTIISISAGQMSIGISAPDNVIILRDDAKCIEKRTREYDRDVTYSKRGDL